MFYVTGLEVSQLKEIGENKMESQRKGTLHENLTGWEKWSNLCTSKQLEQFDTDKAIYFSICQRCLIVNIVLNKYLRKAVVYPISFYQPKTEFAWSSFLGFSLCWSVLTPFRKTVLLVG